LELDTRKRLVRFSKDNAKSYTRAVVAVQLQDVVTLKYSGYDIGVAAQMHGFVKAVSTYKLFMSAEIGSSIGFFRCVDVDSETRQERVKFFNGDFIIDSKQESELEDCWRSLLTVKEFRQAKAEMQELVTARANVERFLNIGGHTTERNATILSQQK
jgi:hypothetical protein